MGPVQIKIGVLPDDYPDFPDCLRSEKQGRPDRERIDWFFPKKNRHITGDSHVTCTTLVSNHFTFRWEEPTITKSSRADPFWVGRASGNAPFVIIPGRGERGTASGRNGVHSDVHAVMNVLIVA